MRQLIQPNVEKMSMNKESRLRGLGKSWVAVLLAGGLLLGCGTSKTAQKSATSDLAEEEIPAEELEELTVRQVKIPDELKYVDYVEKDAQDLFREGLVKVYATPPDYQGATQIFQSAIDKDPTFLQAYFNLGMTFERMKQKERALQVYKQTLSKNPDSLDAKAYVGKIYLAKAREARERGNDFDADKLTIDAKQLLDEVLIKDEDNVAANNSMALYWLSEEDLEKAEYHVTQVLNIEPRNVAGLVTRGLINYLNKNYRIARWLFEQKVLRIDPNSTEALTNLGLTYLAEDEKPKAVFNFAKAIELDPENVPARLNLAAIYLDYLNYEDARLQYTTVVDLQPENVEALIGQGTALWGLGRAEETAASYEAAFALDAKRTMLLERLGKLYEGPLGDSKKGIAYYKQYIAAEQLPPTHRLVQRINMMENSTFDDMKSFDDMDGEGDDMDGEGDDMDGEGDDMGGEGVEAPADETPAEEAPTEEAQAEEAPAEEAPAEEAPAEEAPAEEAPAEEAPAEEAPAEEAPAEEAPAEEAPAEEAPAEEAPAEEAPAEEAPAEEAPAEEAPAEETKKEEAEENKEE